MLTFNNLNIKGGISSTAAPARNGSILFNGLTDKFTNTSNDYILGTGDFTIEFYLQLTTIATSGYPTVLQIGDTSPILYINLRESDSASKRGLIALTDSSTVYATSKNPLVANVWYHIAVVRSNGISVLYTNGVGGIPVACATNFTNNSLYIGSQLNSVYPINGYISNLRIVKGTAVYNKKFTPSTIPLTAIKNTSLLLSASSSSTFITDDSGNNLAPTNSGVTYSTNTTFASGGSLAFGGNQYLLYPDSTNALQFGTDDFTIEMWVYNNSASTITYFAGNAFNSPYNGTFQLGANEGPTTWTLIYYTEKNIQLLSGGIAVPKSTWVHVAIVRKSSVTYAYLNGELSTWAPDSTNYNTTDGMTLGTWGKGLANFWNGNITNVRVLKGTALYTGNFTPPALVLPSTQAANVYGPQSAAIPLGNTVLLLNTYNEPYYSVDSSSNVKVLTPNTTPLSTNQTPFYINGSLKFTGGSDYLFANIAESGSRLDLSTNTYTLEAWIYANSTATRIDIAGAGAKFIASNPDVDWYLSMLPNAVVSFGIASGSFTYDVASNGSISANTWNHVAVTRAETNVTIYLNGIGKSATLPAPGNTNKTIFGIGNMGNYDQRRWNGYISNFRIVKDSLIYTGNFVPPTSPLPISSTGNTALLLNTGGFGVMDSSGYSSNIAANGIISSNSLIHPFYTTGSILFDGSTGFITYPVGGSGTIFDLSSATFTLEMWIYPNTINPAQQLDLTGVTDNAVTGGDPSVDWSMSMLVGGAIKYTTNSGAAFLTVTGGTVIAGTWNHVAVTRSGSNATVWVNGVAAKGTVHTTTNTNNYAFGIGRMGNYTGIIRYWYGYISNFRLVKGTKLYYEKTTYDAPTKTLTAVANTQLLLNTSSPTTYITDTSPNNFTATNNNGIPYVPPSPVNSGGSLYFPGNGTASGNLSVTSSTIFNLAGDFTVEAWIYPTVILGGENGIIDARVTPQSAAVWTFYLDGLGKLNFFTGSYYAGTTVISTNVWTHVAVVRSGSILTHYVNGKIDLVTNIGSGALSPGTTQATIGATKDIGLGAGYGPVSYITNLRLVNGTAVYIAPFVPSTSPLTAVANTVLLLNAASNSSYITDSSPSPVTLVPNSSNVRYIPNGPNVTNNTGILSFNGIDQYLTYGTTSDWAFLHNGTQDYTVEAWVYPTAITSGGTSSTIISTAAGTAQIGMFFDMSDLVAGDLGVWILNGATPAIFRNGISANVNGNTWNHCAFTFSAIDKVGSIYLNGNLLLSNTNAVTYSSSSTSTYALAVGRYQYVVPGGYWPGFITNLRIVKGFAIYNSNFIPSNKPLPVTQAANVYGSRSLEITSSANTSLLLNTAGLATLDSSINKNIANVNGVLSFSTLSPF